MYIRNLFKMCDLSNQYKCKFLQSAQNYCTSSYKDAIEALNALQSNAEYLQKKKTIKLTAEEEYAHTILKTQKYLLRSGISLENLDNLSVIHITGTKGKGSTGAYCESILRHHGYKTGFYISPHLVEVRERIQINGRPINQNVFTTYFWQLYKTLLNNREDVYDMPLYFRFLTVLTFNIFIKENVDVAIIEVGIGGEYDCTNILRKVPVVGITSLGMDHMHVLGNTIEKIAWQKGGIMKMGCKAITVPQDPTAMEVLKQRSIEKNCSLEVVDAHSIGENGLQNHQQKLNISLATALAKNWIIMSGRQTLKQQAIKEGIKNCFWPGRYHTIIRENITYYLDGAHTIESMKTCCDWFKMKTANSSCIKVLIYNTIGDRNSESLLKELYNCNFHSAYFVPNVANRNKSEDFINFNTPEDVQLKRCLAHKEIWMKIANSNAYCYPTVSDVLQDLPKEKNYDILTTGSLHLVGALLSILDPSLSGNL